MGSIKVYLKVFDTCYLWAKKNWEEAAEWAQLPGPLGSWCFMGKSAAFREAAPWRDVLVPSLSQVMLVLFPVLVHWLLSGTHHCWLEHRDAPAQRGLCWRQQLFWAALITAPLNLDPEVRGAGKFVHASGRKGCVHELMGILQRYFSPYSLFFFCGSHLLTFPPLSKGEHMAVCCPSGCHLLGNHYAGKFGPILNFLGR